MGIQPHAVIGFDEICVLAQPFYKDNLGNQGNRDYGF